jgi:hypothetical protein
LRVSQFSHRDLVIRAEQYLAAHDDLIGVPAQSFDVARDAVVGIVAPHHHRQMGVLVPDGLMPVGPTPICNRRQRAGVTALGRYLPHHILACPRLAPRVGEELIAEAREIVARWQAEGFFGKRGGIHFTRRASLRNNDQPKAR